MSTLACVMPVVGICTYIVVFNLNNIAALLAHIQTPALTPRPFQQHNSRVENIDGTSRKKYGDVFGGTRAPQYRPHSYWHNMHFYSRKLLLKAWAIILDITRLIPYRRRKKEECAPTSLGDMRDIHVKVEVDVENCNAI